MSNTPKSIQYIIFVGLVLSSFISITSCNNKAEAQRQSFATLVPAGKDSVEQIAYIAEAIQFYNKFQALKTTSARVGHPISQELSNLITAPRQTNCLDSTKAVFFSLASILESIELIPDSVPVNAGIAVVFGKYPDVVGGPFKTELEAAGLNASDYTGRSTVVIKYVKNLTPGLDSTTYYGKAGSNDQIITNIGMACPKNCPTGTN
ncbi:MAG TPA: hypothetical protein PKD51_07650 [Saprospiraceae bacterium]|nr:hypothetical protein [Saprospiraceae bacterium]